MGFFVHSNTLEIRVINLRGQDSLKIQEISKITIAIYLIVYVAYILINLLGKFVSVMYKKAHLESDFRKKNLLGWGSNPRNETKRESLPERVFLSMREE